MKIGILTFHCAHNYGAVLQAYALQTYLLSHGHDVYVIDYRPRYLTDVYKVFNYRRWVSKNPLKFAYRTLREIRFLPTRCKRHDVFDRFINTRLRLYPYRQPDDLRGFDLVLLGSDQIWNLRITGHKFDDLYWGTSIPVPVASYAASSRGLQPDGEKANYIKDALARLVAISVRENTLQHLLTPLTDKPIAHVVDPTLLIDASLLTPITSHVVVPNFPYVLIYQVETFAPIYKTAREIAKQLGACVIEIAAYANVKSSGGCSLIRTASPETFLAYIKYARCIITTSFHGTALSILFGRPFYTIRRGDNLDERATSLLQALNLEDRHLTAGDIPTFSEPDFTNATKRLLALRKDSTQYIDKAIALSQNK